MIKKVFAAHYLKKLPYAFATATLATCILYAIMIAVIPGYTKNNPWKVNKALAGWNLFLGAFSFIGSLRTVPHLLHFLATQGFRDTVCVPPETVFGDGATGLW